MIHFDRVTYRYPDADHPVLQDVSFDLPAGGFTLVTGPSGSGKSTLLRCLNGLVPHFSGGTLQGTLSVCGFNPVQASPRVMSRTVGFVFQDPETQFVMDRVEAEIVFAMENAGLPRQDMRQRVQEVLGYLNLTSLRTRALETLSGGEKQRVSIAAALALRPAVLVLDEPTSQLSPESAHEVLSAVAHIHETLGITVVLAEHRLERVVPFADRMLHLPGTGEGVVVGTPRAVLEQMEQVPPLIALAKALSWHPLPLTVEQGARFTDGMDVTPADAPAETVPGGEPTVEVEAVSAAYHDQPVFTNVSLRVHAGEVVALMGPNGAGKTTLLKCLVGLLRPSGGCVRVAGQDIAGLDVADICRHVGYLPQDPNALLFADTVEDELAITLDNHGIPLKDAPVPIPLLLAELGLSGKDTAYPRDLSVGERQRVALGAILVTQPRVLLLDEPTRGLDYAAKQALARLLQAWRAQGMAVLLVTHDVEFAASVADRALLLAQGDIKVQGTLADVLGIDAHTTTQVAQLFPHTGWLTVEDALSGLRARPAALTEAGYPLNLD